MADNTRKVRIEEQLKVKIGEAKNLASRNSGNGSTAGARDVYCTVALDQEEICRTPTIERTLSPFFGEEYQFEIPRKFRYLSIYVWDRDRHLKQDKPMGKIAIRREELHIYNHKDHWFSLRPVDADSEVQGMANILIAFDDGNAINSCNSGYLKRKSDYDERVHSTTSNENALKDRHYRLSVSNSTTSAMNDYKENENTSKENLRNTQRNGGNYFAVKARNLLNTTDLSIWNSAATSTAPTTASSNSFAIATRKCDPNSFEALGPFQNSTRSRVSIRVAECVDLAKKNGTCDPYVVFSALYSNKRKIIKRTKVQKKTVNPQFDEIVYFDLNIDNNSDMPSSISSSLSMKHNLHHHLDNNSYTIHPMDGADLCEICISLWHDSPGMGDNVFLGEIKIPMRGKQQQTAIQPDAWYYLQPRTSQSRPARSCATPPGTRLSCDNSLGSLRLKLVYTADHVFPLATYDALMNLLLESCSSESISSNILSSSPLQPSSYPARKNNKTGHDNEATSSSSSSSKALETSFRLPITSSAVYILGEIISSKTDIAQPLVKLFTYKQQIASIIKQLADHEISNLTDPTTIFRGNTLVSKMMDEAMRLSGLHYLHNTLRPVLEVILQEKKPCEIDPTRVKDKSLIDTNLLNLQDYVERVFEAITKSAVKCPPVLCQIFHDLRECAAKHFPSNKEVRYSVVSGFIFLRFFAPAILGPKLFDLTTEQLDCQTSRTLTLISKTIQSLGNLVSSRSAQQPCKEEYTGQLYKKFCTEKHVEAVKHFLEVISTVGAKKNEDTVLEPVLLKEGMMTKRAQGRKRFGRRNFKQRYFRLTTHSLSYSKSKGKRPICDIPLSEILAVEKLNERSFKMQNIFQIIRKDRPLYVQTTNCVEEKEWVDLLSKICQSNAERLQSFHPCAYINGMWSCCSQADENVSGCTKVSSKPFQMELAAALDPARDLQRVHTLIMSHMPRLETYLEYCASANSRNESKDNISSNINPIKISGACNSSHPMVNMYFEHNLSTSTSCQEVVRQLIQVAYNLEHVHRTYKQILAREIKYGSRQAPIGDDNYLHMIRSGVINANGAGMSQQYQASTTIGCTIGLNCELSPMCYPRHEVLRIVNNDTGKVTHC